MLVCPEEVVGVATWVEKDPRPPDPVLDAAIDAIVI
jgi:hypothetical protein